MSRAALLLAALLLALPAQAQQVPDPMSRDAANAQTTTTFNFGTGLYPQYATATGWRHSSGGEWRHHASHRVGGASDGDELRQRGLPGRLWNDGGTVKVCP